MALYAAGLRMPHRPRRSTRSSRWITEAAADPVLRYGSSRAPCSIPARRPRTRRRRREGFRVRHPQPALHPRQSERPGEGRGPRLLPTGPTSIKGIVSQAISAISATCCSPTWAASIQRETRGRSGRCLQERVPKGAPARRHAIPARPASRPGLDGRLGLMRNIQFMGSPRLTCRSPSSAPWS